MKLVWVGFVLLVATIGISVGCGPKEKYCYEDQKPCADVAGAIAADAAWEATPDADEVGCTMFNSQGMMVPCNPG